MVEGDDDGSGLLAPVTALVENKTLVPVRAGL
jgi:hypothetical protein